ncbi:MAG: S-methyl-5-thioribose-1-phosphate isomerase, partial [Nitrospirae bacterium]|nr:S-methyl-5-thioribose-1-phosphate isomerase [Nitrospirota bacterium]
MIPTIEWKNGFVNMLDQTRLPIEIVYAECKDYQTVAKGIKELWVRGAPAIGIAAAMGIALGAQRIKAKSFDAFYEELMPIC